MTEILLANGKKRDTNCPQCGAEKDKRINAAGFGPPVIVCSTCGHEFKEDAK